MAPFRPTLSAAHESRLTASGRLQAYGYGNRQGVNSCNDTLLLASNPWQEGAVEGRAGEERGSSHAGDTFKVVGAAWLAVIELFGAVGRRNKTRQSGVVAAGGGNGPHRARSLDADEAAARKEHEAHRLVEPRSNLLVGETRRYADRRDSGGEANGQQHSQL